MVVWDMVERGEGVIGVDALINTITYIKPDVVSDVIGSSESTNLHINTHADIGSACLNKSFQLQCIVTLPS